ncbi:MAG TPA: hypothetical protein VES60_08185, partial [Nakamurella sp.]|nr:hypothetical protein [Nakamurella sp.]
TENPFPWMSEMMDLKKEKSFFETRGDRIPDRRWADLELIPLVSAMRSARTGRSCAQCARSSLEARNLSAGLLPMASLGKEVHGPRYAWRRPQEREVPARRTHGLPTWGDGRARLSRLRDNSK